MIYYSQLARANQDRSNFYKGGNKNERSCSRRKRQNGYKIQGYLQVI